MATTTVHHTHHNRSYEMAIDPPRDDGYPGSVKLPKDGRTSIQGLLDALKVLSQKEDK